MDQRLCCLTTEGICEEFGTIAWTNGKTAEIQDERPYALASVLYDVLNKVALDATLGKAKAYDRLGDRSFKSYPSK
jgi:hypothetical protein